MDTIGLMDVDGGNKVIDNFDQIKSLMTFGESDNLFLHLQILRRGKDHPDLPAANKLMKSWLVRSAEHLDSLKDEVVFLCEHYGARAYISCAPKSIVKLNALILRKLAEYNYDNHVVNPWHVFNSACGALPGVEKRWVVDVDTNDSETIADIAGTIGMLWVKTHPEDAGRAYTDSWLVGQIPTLNGSHLLVRPFNLQEFKKRIPDVEVKKNGLTALYVPACICEKI